MLGKLLICAVAVAGVLTAGVSGAYAQGAGNLAQTWRQWESDRGKFLTEMAEAQRVCDKDRYNRAQLWLLQAADASIASINNQLTANYETTGEQSGGDPRLTENLISARGILERFEAAYSAEKFVDCDEKDTIADYVRVCDAYGTGFFYIPGTETCLKLDEPIERKPAVRTRTSDEFFNSLFDEFGGRGDTIRGGSGIQDDACDDLGISGPIISSDGNCLQIGGSVDYEFHWGGDADDALSEQLTGAPGFWASVEPSATFGGKATRGAFATEVGGSLVVPGYNFDTSFTGAGLKGEVSATLPLGGFPVTLSGGFELNSASAASSATDVAFPEGFGIPGVGPVPGAYINPPTDMLQFDFTARRQQLSAFFEGNFPMSEGQFMLAGSPAGYRLSGLVGARGGAFIQHEMTTAITSTPAFPTPGATSTYETDFTGGFGGFYAGLSLDKNIPFGDDGLSIQEMFSLAVGYDAYRLDVRDSVLVEGLGFAGPILDQTNSFSVTGGVPTVDLNATVGVGGANWMAGITAGVSLGKNALIDYERLDDGGNPHVGLLPEFGFSIGVNFTGRF